jgi:hypothetical protein
MILLLMARYQWTRLVILNDESSGFHELAGISFDAILQVNKHVY